MKVEAPVRVEHSYRQKLVGSPDQVFPLLCPVREKDWVEGWDPVAVWAESGLAELDCVFLTPHESGLDAVWIVDQYDPEKRALGLIKVVPRLLVTRVRIELSDDGDGGCFAEVSYAHTALGEAGKELVEAFTEEEWIRFMERWERALNHYLETGEKVG